MSAYLDRSQGITFVYSNIFSLYKRAKDAKIDAPFVVERPRVIKDGADVADYEAPKLETERPFAVPMGVREAEEKAKRLEMRPLGKLQKNLSELTDAHEKLRFLLQELESLTKKK